MKHFKADLHIHTLLSPCGSLEMSPVNIVESALKAGLDIIAITDHNSTKQAMLVKQIGEKHGLTVFCGAEINSSEEVHAVALFETDEQLIQFQQYIDHHLIKVKNNPTYFGEQVVVDENEMIIEEVDELLINALDVGLLQTEQFVHQLGGVFIPAHVDRYYNGLFSQLGFIPEGFVADAFELSKNANIENWVQSGKIANNATIIRSSDAHSPEQIGQAYTIFELKEPTFGEFTMALHHSNGRRTLKQQF
ncbi:MAG: PHP domain-containing protein [Prolixibacteraceae bacterium]|nr:PHP domain-containing protein [Prolixibacteraceae bacterium]